MRLLAGTVFDRPPHCERCDQPESDCQCPELVIKPTLVPVGKQCARLSLEKRKKGKVVTVVRGLAASENDFPGLLKTLKDQCGAGGAIDGDVLEIQGDQQDRVKKILAGLGYQVR